MTRNRTFATCILLCLLALLAAPLHARDVGDAIPRDEVLGVDLDGKPVTLAGLGERPVIVTFWATWCSDCMRELPTIEALHKKWPDRATVLGVSIDRNRRDLTRFLKKHADTVTFRVSHDQTTLAARVFDVRETPTTVLVDSSGAIRWRRVGFDPDWLETLSAALESIEGEWN